MDIIQLNPLTNEGAIAALVVDKAEFVVLHQLLLHIKTDALAAKETPARLLYDMWNEFYTENTGGTYHNDYLGNIFEGEEHPSVKCEAITWPE